jgi:AbrB family looped-hinge helix DNA binding protein
VKRNPSVRNPGIEPPFPEAGISLRSIPAYRLHLAQTDGEPFLTFDKALQRKAGAIRPRLWEKYRLHPSPALRIAMVSRTMVRFLPSRSIRMETVILSTKGQLVIPSSIRNALRLKAGNRLSASIDDGNIVLKPEEAPAWKPLNPAGVKLSATELSQAVDLSRENRRR